MDFLRSKGIFLGIFGISRNHGTWKFNGPCLYYRIGSGSAGCCIWHPAAGREQWSRSDFSGYSLLLLWLGVVCSFKQIKKLLTPCICLHPTKCGVIRRKTHEMQIKLLANDILTAVRGNDNRMTSWICRCSSRFTNVHRRPPNKASNQTSYQNSFCTRANFGGSKNFCSSKTDLRLLIHQSISLPCTEYVPPLTHECDQNTFCKNQNVYLVFLKLCYNMGRK